MDKANRKIKDSIEQDGLALRQNAVNYKAGIDRVVRRFLETKQELESRHMYELKGIEELELFLPADELLEVIKYAYSESDEREVPLTAPQALYLMLRNYMSMRRKAWAGEQLLDTVAALIESHSGLSARGKLPNPEDWPTYPEHVGSILSTNEIQPGQPGYEYGFQTHSE